jgi:ACS family glucarate transporter-like MFS transporter
MGSMGMCEGPFWTAAVRMGGRQGGLAAAIFNTGGNAGGVLAPMVTPFFAERYGWEASIGVASVFAVLGALLWIGIDPRPLPELDDGEEAGAASQGDAPLEDASHEDERP